MTAKQRFGAGNLSLPPLLLGRVQAGFASPADDYIEKRLDLNEHLIKHPAATYFMQAQGKCMVNAGINDQALLIVDRSIEARQDDIVIAVIDGDITCKIFDERAGVLRSANLQHKPIPIGENADCVASGVVTYSINRLCMRL